MHSQRHTMSTAAPWSIMEGHSEAQSDRESKTQLLITTFFISGRVENSYIESIPVNNRVLIVDPFRRQQRNADYPDEEFFTDLNTAEGNRDHVAFGDFSIVGDYYTDTGGPAHAVALHHIHFTEDSQSLSIHHFISDRIDTSVDTSGKIIEAVNHLVEALDNLQPSDTRACDE